MHELRRSLSHPRTMALLDQCVVSCCNFLTMLFIGRWLPAHEFGLFSLAMLIVLFLSNLHRAILTQPLNVLGAKEAEIELLTRFWALLRAHVVVLPIAIAVLICMSFSFFPRMDLAIGAACYLVCFLLQETVRRYWYTNGRIDRALISDLVSYGGQAVVLVAFELIVKVECDSAFVILALTSLAGFVVGLFGIKRVHTLDRSTIRTVAAQHWTLSRWLLLTVLALWGSSQMYPFLIVNLGPVAIASFSVSRNLLNVMGIVVQSVVNYLPTRAAVLLSQEGELAFRRHILKTLAQSVVASAVFVLGMQILAEPILHVLYGGAYDAAAPLLRVLSLGMVFSLLGAVLGSYALAMHDSRSTFLSNFGSAVFTFTGGLWLIHLYGVYGAAIAACLSLAVAAVLQAFFVMGALNRLAEQELEMRETCRIEV